MSAPPTLTVVLSDSLSGLPAIPGISYLRWPNFVEEVLVLDDATCAWTGAPLAGAVLTGADRAALDADLRLSALVSALRLDIRDIKGGATQENLIAEIAGLCAERAGDLVVQAAEVRAAMAEVRAHHMQLQADYAELESWIYDALAPDHKLARAWQPTAQTCTVGPDASLRQPLPVSARGVISIDLHLAESAPENTLHLALERPSGGAIAETSLAVTGQHDWVRLTLPTPVGGPPQDAVAVIRAEPAPLRLSLGPELRFADLCAVGPDGALNAPLALKVYQTTSRMSPPPLLAPGEPLPADGVQRLILPRDLGAPALLPFAEGLVPRPLRAYPDGPEVAIDETRDAIRLRPSARRAVVARLPGLRAVALRQVRGIVQIGRHDTFEIRFAIAAVPAGSVGSVQAAMPLLGDWQALMPGAWGEVWCEPDAPLSGEVDLLLAVAMPNGPFNTHAEALFRGFRVTGGV